MRRENLIRRCAPPSPEGEGFKEMIADMKKLKPCPFCGGMALGPTDAWPHLIMCSKCGAQVKGFAYAEDGEMEAIEKWNTRVVQRNELQRESH